MATSEPHHSELKSLLEHYQNGRYEDAEKSALILTDKFQTHPFGWKVLGAVLNQTGRISEGLIACQKSVELAPENAEAHYNLGNTLHKLGRFEEAEKSCIKSIALAPKNAEAHYNLGNTLKELGRFKEAEESYRQVIDLKPDFAAAYNNLGSALKELGRLDEAESSYKQAITLKPDYTLALLNIGQLFFDKGEFEIALNYFDLCDTKRSRARALSSLYALGRIEDIYSRIEKRSKTDDENLWIAAIAAFLAKREKKDTTHNFCNNPLEFIHFSNISSHLEDSDSFISEVIKELHHVNTIWEPSNKTTRKGFQSNINLFENPLEKMSRLKSIIINELDLYYSKFKSESCTYIQKWPSEKRLFGWHVILKQHGNQNAHIHPSGWLSGVIYLKVVPTLEKDEGAIELGLNGARYSHVDSPKIIYQPKLGDIVFFPSSLHHRTIPFTTDTDRIVVAFDLMPKAAKN